MSLLNPVSESKSLHIDRKNLLSFASNDEIDPVTQLALECFGDIQANRLGAWHYVKKYSISTLAFTAALAGPTIAAGYALWNHVPHTVEAAAGVSAAALTLFAVNQGTKRIADISPIKTVVTLTTGALFYGAMQIGSCCSRSYTLREEEANAFITTRYIAMKESLKATYEGMARLLLTDLEEANDKPDGIFSLKATADKVADRFDAMRSRLSYFGLSPSEITEATNALQEACRAVQEYKISLRDAPAYNVKLLLSLPQDKLGIYCIPESVIRNLQDATERELTTSYRVRKFVNIIAGAALPLVGTGCALYATESDYKFGALGLLISTLATSIIVRLHKNFEHESKEVQLKKRAQAKEELLLAYKTLADYCSPPSGKKRKRLPAHLKEAKALNSKLVIINAAIDTLGFESKEITGKLKDALASL